MTLAPEGRKLANVRCAVMASALTPMGSLGRPGRCTSPAETNVVTPPLTHESIQPSWFCRGVQSPNTGWQWLSIRPGRDGAALGIDDEVGLVGIDILALADRRDAAVDGNDRIGIEDRLAEIAREQQADVAHDELALHRPGGSFDGHSGAPQSSQAQQRSWRAACE